MAMRCALAITLLGFLLAACAYGHHKDGAGGQANPAKTIIALMDSNGDGQVSWQENSAYFAALFTRLDVNHDGFISAEEFKAIDNDPLFKAMPLQKLGVSFDMFDRNDDGKLSRDEFEHMGDRIFTLLDRNMDGVVSEADFGGSKESSSDNSSGKWSGGGRHGGGSGGSGGF